VHDAVHAPLANHIVSHHLHAMRFQRILFVAVVMCLAACSTTPRQNDQQAFESTLTEAGLFLKTLQTLDSGDIAKTRQVAMIPIYVDMASLPDYAAKSHLTAEQTQELTAVARGTLDYLLAHRKEFDGRLLTVQMCVRGLRKLLTEPEDVRKLTELSDYFQSQKP
jgi:hypothetical protein